MREQSARLHRPMDHLPKEQKPPSAIDQLPRILILDADDSYTNNILDLIHGSFPKGSITPEQFETRVIVIRAKKFDWSTLTSRILPHFAAIILGPGPGRPGLDIIDQTSSTSVQEIDQNTPRVDHPATTFTKIFSPEPLPGSKGYHIPTFGLCLGHQALGFAYGATVHEAPKPLHGQTCALRLELDRNGNGIGILNRVKQGATVVRYNSLIVDPKSLSHHLKVTAWSQDQTSRTVMGLCHRTLPFYGVQFHPESICSTNGSEIIQSFLDIVSKSAHVNHGLGVPTSYSDLPNQIATLSEINIDSWTHLRYEDTQIGPLLPEEPAFELRTMNFYNKHFVHGPKEIFEQHVKSRSGLGSIWLDSTDSIDYPNRKSHMASIDFLLGYSALSKTLSITDCNYSQTELSLAQNGFWDWLRTAQEYLEAYTELSCADDPLQLRAPVGFLGYIGYEMLSESLADHQLPCQSNDKDIDVQLGFCNTAFSYDHSTSTWAASALVRVDMDQALWVNRRFGGQRIGLNLCEYQFWLSAVSQAFDVDRQIRSQEPDSRECSPEMPPAPLSLLADQFKPLADEKEYLQRITDAQAEIIAGESYELCLTTQFKAKVESDDVSEKYRRYLKMRESNRAPYGAYLEFPRSKTSILSASPEKFLSLDRSGEIEMKPIKGTARRNLEDEEEDTKIRERLKNDPKERGENLMITDLIRHDLNKFCEIGTVRVTKLFEIESVSKVHSLVSTINGKLLKPKFNSIDCLKYSFPPGSMTGSPKIRSIEILNRLENSEPRGVYSGLIGFICVDGSMNMSVVIRTAIFKGLECSIGGGGAITHLSKKEDEWNEVNLKVESVISNLS